MAKTRANRAAPRAKPKTTRRGTAKRKPAPEADVGAKPVKASPRKQVGDEVFEKARAEFERQLERDYHGTDAEAIYAFARLAHDPAQGDAVRELVLGGFDRLIAGAKKSKELINSVAYHALAFAALEMPPHPDIGPALHRGFRVTAELTDVEVHYNMNQACGAFAIALATLDYRDVIDDIAKFRERFDHYDGTPFHTQVLYAQWMFEGDGAGARAYVADSEQLKCLGWAAAALADLDHKPGRGTIMARMGGRLHAESREALLEASARLRTQSGPPAVADRMIWMFGRVSPVEIALGYETDNVFRDRAVAKRAGRD